MSGYDYGTSRVFTIYTLLKTVQKQLSFGVSFIFHLQLKPQGIIYPLTAHLSDWILHIYNL